MVSTLNLHLASIGSYAVGNKDRHFKDHKQKHVDIYDHNSIKFIHACFYIHVPSNIFMNTSLSSQFDRKI